MKKNRYTTQLMIFSFFSIFLMCSSALQAGGVFKWKGTNSSSWTDQGNWTNTGTDSDGIPDADDDVTIDASLSPAHYPQLPHDFTILRLTMKGGQLNLAGHKLTLLSLGYSEIKNAQIIFGSTGQIVTKTGQPDHQTPYGAFKCTSTTFSGNVKMTGGLQFHTCTFGSGNHVLDHIGDSHYNGGNTINGNVTLINDQTVNNGHWYWGDNKPDVFHGNVIVKSFSKNRKEIHLASNSAGNIFHGTVDIRTYTGGSIKIAHVSSAEADFKQAVTIRNETIDPNGERVSYIGYGGKVIFRENLNIKFTTTGASQGEISVAGNTGDVTFEKDVIIDNDKVAPRVVRFGNTNQFLSASPKVHFKGNIVLQDFENGTLYFQYCEKTSATPVDFSELTENNELISKFSDWKGNITADAGLIHLRENIFRNQVNFVNYGRLPLTESFTSHRHSGGNTFKAVTNLSLGSSTYRNGNEQWIFGYGKPDVFENTLTAEIHTIAATTLHLSKNSKGNAYQAIHLNSYDNGEIVLGDASDQTSFISGAVDIKLKGTKYQYFAARGITKFSDNITAEIDATAPYLRIADKGGSLDFVGSSTKNITITDHNTSPKTQELDFLTISGGGNLVLKSDLTVTKGLKLESGRINVENKILDVGKSIINGGDIDSYVIAEGTGHLAIKADNAVSRKLPMGGTTANSYMELNVEHTQGGTVNFKVKAPSGGASNGLTNYWNVTHDKGRFDAKLIPKWETAAGSDGSHYLMVGQNPSWGSFTATAGTVKGTTNTIHGQANGFLGDFDVASSANTYAGANQTISSCSILEMSAVGTGSWTTIPAGATAKTATNIPNAKFDISGLTNGPHVFTWTANGSPANVTITVSQSGGGGAKYQVWTGADNNKWFNCANWKGYTDANLTTPGSNGVPDINTSVFITGNASTSIQTDATPVSCKFLSVDSGSKLDLGGSTITVTDELLFFSAEIFGAKSQIISKGNMKLRQTTFHHFVTINFADNGTAKYPSINGGNTFNSDVSIIQNSAQMDLRFGSKNPYTHDRGYDIFKGDVRLRNNQTEKLIISENTSGNTIAGDVYVQNMSSGWVQIGNDDYTHLTETTLADGKSIDLTGSTDGSFKVIRMLQTGGTPNHRLNTSAKMDIYIFSSQMRGNLDIYGKNVELRENKLGTDASSTILVKTNSTQVKRNGGNTFLGKTTLEHTGSSSWYWGESGGGDKFMGDATIINDANNNNAYTLIANSSNDTEFHGTTFMTVKSKGGIVVADTLSSSKAVFKGKTHLFGNRTVAFDDATKRGRDAINVARTGEVIFEDDLYATFEDQGTTDTYGSYMSFAYDSGKVVFEDVILDDKTSTARRRGYYIGNPQSVKDNAGTFTNQVILNGKLSTKDANGFIDGGIYLSNITQKGTNPINLDSKNAILTFYNSKLKGDLNIKTKAAAYRWDVFEGKTNLSVVEPAAGVYYNNSSYGNFRCGGNHFKAEAHIVYNTNTSQAASQWEWGAGSSTGSTIGPDVFDLKTIFDNNCNKTLIIGNGTEGNKFHKDLIVNNTANGQIEIAKDAIPTDKVNVAVKGDVVLNNASSTTDKRISVAEDGIFQFGKNLTTQSGGGEIYLAQGGVATKGWIQSDSYLFATVGVDTAVVQTLNFATNKTILHKLQNGSVKLNLASDVNFVTSDTEAHLRFKTGHIYVNNFNMNLNAGKLTKLGGGSTKADFKNNYVVAAGTGYFKRKIPLNTNVILPIATPSKYYPVILRATAGSDVMGGRIGTLLSDLYSNTHQPQGSLIRNYFTSVSWILSKDNNTTASNVSVDVQWNGAGDELPNFDRTKTDLNRYNKFITSIWQCSGTANSNATNNGDGTYSVSRTYTGLKRMGVFAPSSPYVNAGPDITVSSCQFGALNAHVFPGTSGVGEWIFVSSPNGKPAPTLTTPKQNTSDITNVQDGGQYTFKWTVKKPIAANDGTAMTFCTPDEDQVTITTNGTSGPLSSALGAQTYWTGGVDTDWYNCQNWNNGIPGNNTSVFITTNTKVPQVPSNLTLKSLKMYNNGKINLNGHEVSVREEVSFNTAEIQGVGSIRILPKLSATSDVFDITNTTFKERILLEADAFDIASSQFQKDAKIAKIGIAEDRWRGGNSFKSASITLASNANMYLAVQQGNIFNNSMEVNVETSTHNIYFTTAFITTSFRGGTLYLKSTKKLSDFYFGDGTVSFDGSSNQWIYNQLNGYNLRMQNIILNKNWHTTRVELRSGDLTISNHMKLQKGYIKVGIHWNKPVSIRLKNPDPNALILERGGVGDPEPYQSSVHISSYNGHFSRLVDFSRTDEYKYPLRDSREFSITPDGTGAGSAGNIQEMNLHSHWIIRSHYYDNNGWGGNDANLNQEYIRRAWVLTQTNPEAQGKLRIKMHWKAYEERPGIDRSAMFPTTYNYDTDKWECIGIAKQAGVLPKGESSSNPNYFVTTSDYIADFNTASTNFGIFGVASAKANTSNTTLFQTVRECLTIQLDATKNLQSPIGGMWHFASASPNMKDISNNLITASHVVFSSVTSPKVYASVPTFQFTGNLADKYLMSFRWVRKCVTDCGSPKSCGDGSELNDDFVTVTIVRGTQPKSKIITWTGAASNKWNECANWSDGIPDHTTEKIIIPKVKNYAKMPSPSDATFRRFITALEVSGGLDLNGNHIEVQDLTFQNGFTTGFYTGALIHNFDKKYVNKPYSDPNYHFMTGNFITVTRTLKVRKSTFYNNIGIVIDGLKQGKRPSDIVSYNGGNVFKENSIIHAKTDRRIVWGWNDRYDKGGPDIFEKNLQVLSSSKGCGGSVCPTIKLPPRRLYGATKTNYPTNFKTDIDWFAPKYFDNVKRLYVFYPESYCCGNTVCGASDTIVNANSVTLCANYDSPTARAGSNRGKGYVDYPRFDDRYTQAADPDIGEIWGALNTQATSANKQDEQKNVSDFEQAQKNVEESHEFVTAALPKLVFANSRAVSMNNFASAYKKSLLDLANGSCDMSSTATNAEKQNYQKALNNIDVKMADLKNLLDNGGCGTAVGAYNSNMSIANLITQVGLATQHTLEGKNKSPLTHDDSDPTKYMNAPGDDNAKAIEGNSRANQANACAYELHKKIRSLYYSLGSARYWYNRMLTGESSSNMISFAYDSKGTEFRDSTQFYVEDCSRLRIAERYNTGAKFTGKYKKHDFINRSNRRDALILAQSKGSYVEFSGGHSRTNTMVHDLGSSYFAHSGKIKWVDSDTLNISNTGIPKYDNLGKPASLSRDIRGNYTAGNTFIGGSWGNRTSRADLNGQLVVEKDSLTAGTLLLINFNQNNQKHQVDIQVDHKAGLQIEGNSSFASRVNLVNRVGDYLARNGNYKSWNYRDAIKVGCDIKNTKMTFSGLLTVKHDLVQQKYYDFEEQEATNAGYNKPWWSKREKSANDPTTYIKGISRSKIRFHARAVIDYDGGVLIENKIRDTRRHRSTQFGDFGQEGYGNVSDSKGFRIGTEGYRSGYLEVSRLYKHGKGKQLFLMSPDIILPSGQPFIHPDFGVPQKTSVANTVLRVEDCKFEGKNHLEAPMLGVRANVLDGETKVVSYGGDGGYISGGNLFTTVATFELRSMKDLTGAQSIRGKWLLGNGIPDTYRGDINLNNYSVGGMMGMATYNNPAFVTVDKISKFEGKVTIHNRPTEIGGKRNISMFWYNEDRISYRWHKRYRIRNPRFLIGGYENARAVFEKEVVITNETNLYDVEIGGYENNTIRFKKGVKLTNKYPKGYTPQAACTSYDGDITFGREDASTGLMVGGFTTVDKGIHVQDFVDGMLELNGVAVTSNSVNSLLSFDMPDQLPGDAGKARLHLGFCSINQKLEARSRWIRSNTSHYGQDVNFTRVEGGCDAPVNWRAGNIYEKDFKLLDESKQNNADIIMASYGQANSENLGDIYKGHAVFESDVDAKSRIIVSDKFIAQFNDNINLTFNTITPLNNITNLDTEAYTQASTIRTSGWFAGIKVAGGGEQKLNSSHPVMLNRLKVYQKDGSSTLEIDQEMTIKVEAKFDKGKIVLDKKDVNIENSKDGNSVTVLNPNYGHFVANSLGTVNREVFPIPGIKLDGLEVSDGYGVLFPVGNLTNYLPATITLRPSVGAVRDMYRVRLFDDVYTTYNGRWDSGTKGGNASFIPSDDAKYAPSGSPTSIDRNFVRRSWVITEDQVGGTNGTLTLQWYEGDANVATDEPPGFDRQKTTIVHYQADKDEWRCMEELSPVSFSAKTDGGGRLIRKRTFQLLTDNNNANEKQKMGVFSVGSLTAGEDKVVTTCGAGAAQLSATPLSPPLTGIWDFVTVYHDETGEFIPPDVFASTYTGSFTAIEENQIQNYAGFNTAIAYNDIADPNGIVFNLEANKVYMFKWQPKGLEGNCSTDFATVLVRTGSFTSATKDKTLVWQGNDQYFWDCTNWLVKGGGTNYALPNPTMDLVVPMVTAIGSNPKPWYPEYYDKVLNLGVKSIRVEDNASFTVGGLDVTSQKNAQNSVELTVSEFITVHKTGKFINRYRLIVKDSIHNEGKFSNVPYFITGSVNDNTSPDLVVYDAFANRGANSNFEASGNSKVTLYGDLINEGKIFHTAGQVNFMSASSFITGGSPIYLRKVTLEKQNPTDFLSITNTNLFITAHRGGIDNPSLTFNRGKIATYSKYQNSKYAPSLLAFMSGAKVLNSNAERYVSGPVSNYFDAQNDKFIYPIGKNYWARAALSEVAVTSPEFVTAEYFAQGFASAPLYNTPARPLKHVSELEYWMIDQSKQAGNTHARVTLFWENGARSDIKNTPDFSNSNAYLNSLVVAHLSKDLDNDGTEESATAKWINEGGLEGSFTPSTVAKGAVISHATTKIKSFSPQTFAADPEKHPLPVTWQYVQAKLITDGKESLIQWGTSSEIGNDYFEVLRSTDGKNFTVIGIVDASNLGRGDEYAFIDENPYVGINYYRIRQVDYNGTPGLSRIVSVNRDAQVLRNQMRVYPNPTNPSNINLSVYSELEGKVNVRMFDAIGQEVFTKVIHLEKGQNTVNISPNFYLTKGVYVIFADELLLRSKVVIE